jgi:hypothetical protein
MICAKQRTTEHLFGDGEKTFGDGEKTFGDGEKIVRSVIRPKVNLVFNDCATRLHRLQQVARNGRNVGELALVNCTGA